MATYGVNVHIYSGIEYIEEVAESQNGNASTDQNRKDFKYHARMSLLSFGQYKII